MLLVSGWKAAIQCTLLNFVCKLMALYTSTTVQHIQYSKWVLSMLNAKVAAHSTLAAII